MNIRNAIDKSMKLIINPKVRAWLTLCVALVAVVKAVHELKSLSGDDDQ